MQKVTGSPADQLASTPWAHIIHNGGVIMTATAYAALDMSLSKSENVFLLNFVKYGSSKFPACP